MSHSKPRAYTTGVSRHHLMLPHAEDAVFLEQPTITTWKLKNGAKEHTNFNLHTESDRKHESRKSDIYQTSRPNLNTSLWIN